ncbi:MAG: response regulator receiver protein [Segetibacter sp.]|nr:response regulator receiver protein [Segetibacter sp.]
MQLVEIGSIDCGIYYLSKAYKEVIFTIMYSTQPILIIEDDPDDREFIQSALNDIGVKNEQKCFQNGQEALDYLQKTSQRTFLILSDVNKPIVDGFELKREINKDDKLRIQSIPFVFLSTTAQPKEVENAYELMVQGFFQKPNSFDDIKNLLVMVTNYWRTALHPKAGG